DFEVEYDWKNMLSEYTLEEELPTWNEQEAVAVATLMLHCGVAVEMDYKSTSSGAYTQNVIPAFCDYFGYDNGAVLRSRNLYTTAEWQEMIKKELDENRPVLYGGQTSLGSGHQFIVDGYAQTDDYFHLNWGWSGYGDGYYRLSGLKPVEGGTGGAGANLGYNYGQDAILGLQKAQKEAKINNEIYFLNYNPPGISTSKPRRTFGLYTNVDYIIKDESFTFYYSFLYDYGMRDFTGEIALFLEDKTGKRKSQVWKVDMNKEVENGVLESGYTLYEDQGVELTITEKVEEGDLLRMYYKPEGYEWRPIRGEKVTETLPVYAESPVSNQVIQLEENIQVFPTRVQTGLTVYLPETVIAQRILLHDMSGRLIKSETIHTSDSDIYFSLSGQQPGIYILSIETSKGGSRHKIIKE
ncbi:C10 family peptidase, partial [Parabacteroides sp. OttesenSCG-928-O15]|nr:C10 family peptidase [Parabacteroides sp. OttesenSCG-928-O15]